MTHGTRRSRLSSKTPENIVEMCPTVTLSVIFLSYLFVNNPFTVDASLLRSSTLGFTSTNLKIGRQSLMSDRFKAPLNTISGNCFGLSSLFSTQDVNVAYDLPAQTESVAPRVRNLTQKKREWFDKSIRYYGILRRMNEESMENVPRDVASNFLELASEHYFALNKIRDGKLDHAEKIYVRAIDRIQEGDDDHGHCDHSALASSTLLLALLKQRMGDIKGARSVFLKFFRHISETEVDSCSCSAKVLQAYALFEMKQGFSLKSLKLIERAVSLDGNLSNVLRWKQFSELRTKYDHIVR
eukprot:CAMPEP_0113301816 /NCGR_PEP_ID=MMETSP0010_2-20120614/2886_1 /TAXON_ID=216773 ORGANISM="Corethron hystrix, Strain 308" /NCGR_SAMPLE_ID=MMETSP0010_2 /ASSEMBLY_ACC=CAM_ASM_000155 /LENGTH=297 /DNA_ID=CAMNT_0000155499 /DNA_START=251 /DNA_END=1144 /DNA_ORIENTATION=+ /assembly_acc=CAM_ASM_000155